MRSTVPTGPLVPNVLTIAGSDPSGGAGIQGDLKTFAAFRVHGCAVPAALTAQNSLGVHEVFSIPPDVVRRQLEVLFDDVEIHAVKIGMLGDASVVRAVADVLRRRSPPFVVLDPVIQATLGGALLDAPGLDALRDELMPLVTLITPNAVEAGVLLRRQAPETESDALLAARDLCDAGAHAALVTGGHLQAADDCLDVLHERSGRPSRGFRAVRVRGAGAHGTGCALSSAITALLALGAPLAKACEHAQQFVAAAIAASDELRVGNGRRPVHALHHLWRCDGE